MANLGGEDALVATSSLVFQTLRADVRFSEFIVLTNFSELAAHVRRFLQGAFGGNEWSELRVNVEILRGYDDLADALVDALNQPMPLGADIMSEAFNLLATDMADDGRVLLFLERIEEAAMAAAYNKSESVDARSKRASETAVDEEVNLVELMSRRGSEHCFCDRRSCLADFNVLSFEELHLLQTQINAARDGWRLFLSTSASQEAAGEAFYSALLEGAPSLQSLFTSPRAVQARIICTISRDPLKPEARSWRSVVGVTAGAIGAGGDPDRVPEGRGDSGPITPRVTSVTPEGGAFVQSFTNLRDFAWSSAGGPALPVLRNDDYNGPVTQAGVSFTQMNVGTGASRCDAFTISWLQCCTERISLLLLERTSAVWC